MKNFLKIVNGLPEPREVQLYRTNKYVVLSPTRTKGDSIVVPYMDEKEMQYYCYLRKQSFFVFPTQEKATTDFLTDSFMSVSTPVPAKSTPQVPQISKEPELDLEEAKSEKLGNQMVDEQLDEKLSDSNEILADLIPEDEKPQEPEEQSENSDSESFKDKELSDLDYHQLKKILSNIGIETKARSHDTLISLITDNIDEGKDWRDFC